MLYKTFCLGSSTRAHQAGHASCIGDRDGGVSAQQADELLIDAELLALHIHSMHQELGTGCCQLVQGTGIYAHLPQCMHCCWPVWLPTSSDYVASMQICYNLPSHCWPLWLRTKFED